MTWIESQMEPVGTGSDPNSTPPRLAFHSLPSASKRPEPPGMMTPPIRLPGAIPFHWEEAPGKPRGKPRSGSTASAAARSLGLPPRLAAPAAAKEERKVTKMPSPTTVLDGPYFLVRHHASFSFGKERKVRGKVSSERVEDISPCFSFSSSSRSSSVSSWSFANGSGEREEGEGEEEEEEDGKVEVERGKVRVMSCRRHRSLTCVTSHTATHFWARIYGRLKQAVVPWKRDSKT